jgi:hypothetical protein
VRGDPLSYTTDAPDQDANQISFLIRRSENHIPNIKLSTCHSSGVVGSLLMSSVMLLIVKKKHLQRKRQVPIDHPSRILIQVCPSINSRPCSQDGRNRAAPADELRKRSVAVVGSVAVRGAVQGPPVRRRIKKRDRAAPIDRRPLPLGRRRRLVKLLMAM